MLYVHSVVGESQKYDCNNVMVQSQSASKMSKKSAAEHKQV